MVMMMGELGRCGCQSSNSCPPAFRLANPCAYNTSEMPLASSQALPTHCFARFEVMKYHPTAHSAGNSHSSRHTSPTPWQGTSSSMACCKEIGFWPSTVQPTAKQVPRISLASPRDVHPRAFLEAPSL